MVKDPGGAESLPNHGLLCSLLGTRAEQWPGHGRVSCVRDTIITIPHVYNMALLGSKT